LDGEFLSAELFEGDAILLLLFLGSLFFRALFEAAVFLPTGENDPAHNERGEGESGPGIKEGILEGGFFFADPVEPACMHLVRKRASIEK